MADHRGKCPNRILQQHIVLGGDHDESTDLTRVLDNSMINYNDPMEFTGSANLFEGQSADEVQAANLAQAAGLTSAYQEPRSGINMTMANSNEDEAEKGGMQYGPMNTKGRTF